MGKFKKNLIFDKYLEYIQFKAPLLYFRVNKKGRIKGFNQYSTEVVGPIPLDTYFQEIIIDFNSDFDLSDAVDSSEERLLSISNESGSPTSYNFTFIPDGNDIIIFGHSDLREAELMRNELVLLNQELSNAARELHKKNAQLQQALTHIKTLQGIIPICSHCHKIRNDQEVWDELETYLSKHTDAKLSHGICPECMQAHYPDFSDDD